MNRVTPWETLMEAHSDTDVQIVQLIIKQWARGTNRTGGVAASSLVFYSSTQFMLNAKPHSQDHQSNT